jgi:hypothetical protein
MADAPTTPRFVVACTTDYYNDVEIVETREEADALAAEWRVTPPGHHHSFAHRKPLIVVGEVLSVEEIPQKVFG